MNGRTLNQRLCSVEQCGRKHYALGYCAMHRARVLTRGTTEPRPRLSLTTPEYLRRYMSDRATPCASGCIEWNGGRSGDRYGTVRVDGRDRGAHRVSLCLATGKPIDHPLHALHSCDNPGCINPEHLRWGTPQENADDISIRHRMPRGSQRPESKLTENDVRFIRASKRPTRELAEFFGVAHSTMNQIRRGELWKHVT